MSMNYASASFSSVVRALCGPSGCVRALLRRLLSTPYADPEDRCASHVCQDAGFRDQVVDLALLVLVGMAGPDVDDALR